MNDPEDRPTSSNRPPPYGDPRETQGEPQATGGPPAEPVDPGESFASPVTPPAPPPPLPPSAPTPPPFASAPPAESPAEPEARWEDVVDPAPAVAPEPPRTEDWPEPSRVRAAPPVAAPTSQAVEVDRDPIDNDSGDTAYDDEYDDAPASRWVSLLATLGTALIGIVTVQVVTSLVEGLTLKSGQRVGVPTTCSTALGTRSVDWGPRRWCSWCSASFSSPCRRCSTSCCRSRRSGWLGWPSSWRWRWG